MIIYRSIDEVKTIANAVITIGTFDGVHKGHQRIIKRLATLAAEIGGQSVLITFYPHPRMVISPDAEIKMLNTLDEKLKQLETYGIDVVVVVPFNREFSDIDAHSYVKDFLIDSFKPHTIVIGYDHKFGRNRVGDIALLREVASKSKVRVIEIEKKEVDESAVSSTRIRKALLEGKVAEANTLSGHFYSLTGIVVKGDQIGRELGYPTANISVQNATKLIPGDGVYTVQVKIKDALFGGMLSIGIRPTFNGKKRTIEVNIFDFSQDIYGEEITLIFLQYLRGEAYFPSPDALIHAMENDKIKSLEILDSLK
ncbi:MAG: riboflavin kinase/FMN adenylyltransferase [Limisphaerales bacterium]